VTIWKSHGTDIIPMTHSDRSLPRRGLTAVRRVGSWIVHLDAGSIALGGLILWFVVANLRLWILHPGLLLDPTDGAWTWRAGASVATVALELLQGTLFFARRRDTGGRRPMAVWAAATVGSWAFLLARPVRSGFFDSPALFGSGPLFGLAAVWFGMVLLGDVLAFISLSSLGRSFGLLAANRGVRTEGAYRIVRHPAYASYFVVQFGFVLENFSPWNVAIFAVVVLAQLMRIAQEEQFLSQDAEYQRYQEQVRYRLVPGIY
jgi:protein-S-isoprenylcysteine O-methyltransferase Ste14